MLGVLGEAGFRALLLTVAVQLGLWLLRIRRPQLLLVTWTMVLAASLAMPAIQWVTPFHLPIKPRYPAEWLIGAPDLQQQRLTVAAGPSPADDVQLLPAMSAWLEAIYLLVSGVMLLRLMVGIALSIRLLREAEPVEPSWAPKALIRISRLITAPVTVGCVILLPRDVVDWSPAMRQAVIAHECAHVARRDFVLLILSQCNRALFWFSPVSWLLHRRLAILTELASDDDAMRVMGDRTGYAEVLLEMGRRSGPLLRGVPMARTSTLPYRIERVLSVRAGPAAVSGFQRSMMVVGAGLVAIAAASPEFGLGAPPLTSAGDGSLGSGLALSGDFASSRRQMAETLAQPSLMLSQAEDTFPPSSHSVAQLSWPPTLPVQQPSRVEVAARPTSRLLVTNTHPAPPTRRVQARSPAIDSQGGVVARAGLEALNLPPGTHGATEGAERSAPTDGAGRADLALVEQRAGRRPLVEPSLFKVLDQQTCTAVYLPGSGGSQNGTGWEPLNFMRARFFLEANGRSWLKLYLGERNPVTLPIKVTDNELEFTAAYNTSFKVLPQGIDHLIGTTERPSGKIDFACSGPSAHLSNRKS